MLTYHINDDLIIYRLKMMKMYFFGWTIPYFVILKELDRFMIQRSDAKSINLFWLKLFKNYFIRAQILRMSEKLIENSKSNSQWPNISSILWKKPSRNSTDYQKSDTEMVEAVS